ncbi:uncharacterized protein LOC110838706 isoform X2 [Zootermopsis nevadensis]|nr:uncharacterized protein LOC110838706 isoform X2 [Zootermopsis nevadensis]XP_021937883.1 uncharacterized protein LOC110838706 isoform X2 [Zootermopsis nevadensis]
MKAGGLQYASCPQLEKRVPEEAVEERAVRHLTSKYDSYHGFLLQQQNRRRVSSLDGSETATDVSSSSSSSAAEERLQVTEQERLQVGTFFRGLKTQVFVCGSLANLYLGSTSCEGQWELSHMGIPLLVLDSGETRSRNKRRIQIVLAERGTCFTLWQDIIDNLSSYRVAGQAFHTMHLSSDHSVLVGLSFDSLVAADEMWGHVERLTARPENISLSVPGRRGKKPRRTPKPQPLPAKSHISQPCCFQHVTSVDVADRMRYLSLRVLVPGLQDKTVTDL